LASPDSPRQGVVPNYVWLAGAGVDHAAYGFEVVGGVGAVQGGAGDVPGL